MAKSLTAYRTLTHNNGYDIQRAYSLSINKSMAIALPSTPTRTKSKSPKTITSPLSPSNRVNKVRRSTPDRRARLTRRSSPTTLVLQPSPSPKLQHNNELILHPSTPTPTWRLNPQPCISPHDLKLNTKFHKLKITATSPCALTSFDSFEKLPVELRFKIWRLAAGNGSIVAVRKVEGKLGYGGNVARCPLLLACKESRQEVLKMKVDLNCGVEGAPKMYVDFGVDILHLAFDIERGEINAPPARPLWQKVFDGSMKDARKLAVSYKMFKFYGTRFSDMVMKIDLEELVLVVDEYFIEEDDVPVMIQPRSVVGRRSRDWKTWGDVTRSEARKLEDAKWNAGCKYKKYIGRGETPASLLARGIRDLPTFKVPRVTMRDIVNSKNVRPSELQSLEEEEEYENFELPDCATESDSD